MSHSNKLFYSTIRRCSITQFERMPFPLPVSHQSSLMKSSCSTANRLFGFAGVFRCLMCLIGVGDAGSAGLDGSGEGCAVGSISGVGYTTSIASVYVLSFGTRYQLRALMTYL